MARDKKETGLSLDELVQQATEYNEASDPSEEEIKQRAEAIRAGWTPETEQSRRVSKGKPIPADIKRYNYDRKTMTFQGNGEN